MELPERYVLYRREWDSAAGKWQKIPCGHQGHSIDPPSPDQWRTFEDAARYATWNDTKPNAPYGVGWVLNGDGFFLLDVDGALDSQGQWSAESQAIFLSFGGALGEVSTSGKGLHIIGRCDPDLPKTHKNKWDGDKEFYTSGRFVALSRDGLSVIGGGEYVDKDWTDQLRRLIPERPFLGDLPDGRDPTYTGPEDDDELIGMMLRTAGATSAFGGGVTIKDLWEANAERLATKYPDPERPFDHSAADAALMGHLAFWTGKDMPRMDRLFRRSALMRDKYEKRADYRRDTTQNVARMCKRVYDRGQTVTSSDNEEWPEPAPRFLRTELPPAPELPLRDVLGERLAQWVENAAASKSAPPDYVFAALLAVAGATIGNTRWVTVWQGWNEPPIIWTMCIGAPSSGKSPAIDAVLQPLRKAERPLRETAQRLQDGWRQESELANLADQAWKEQVKAAIKKKEQCPERPHEANAGPMPHIPRLVVNDGTIERLGAILARQPRGTLQMRDELAGWLQGMQRYSGGGSDRPFWLEAFGGRGFTVERMGREPLTIDRLSIGVLGGIQPDRLKSLLFNSDDDGLLARFVPIHPQPAPLRRPQPWTDDALMEKLIERLLSLDLVADETGGVRPWFISLNEEACDLMDKFRQKIRGWEVGLEGLMLSFIGKLPGLAARVSLVLAHLDWASEGEQEPREITAAQFGRATRLVEAYLLPMARRAYADSATPKAERAARKLVEVIKEHGWQSFTARQVMRLEITGVARKVDLDPALSALEDGECIRLTETAPNPKGGRPQRLYAVNPALHQPES
uniref:phage NrS-1 polymerase family protein n=1 Tax=Roseovarius sp. BRH_c41 TaxID=1629709 RepID=UPI000A6BFF17|nr:DUF3987 domain-containing protein [Roseovarius sp. BRH_c41]